ncbi:MAG: response regulator transcription factor [Mangrovicoccus sp.]
MPQILIVEDDPELASGLIRGLKLHGYEAHLETRVSEANIRLRQENWTAAIVDVMLGPDSGLELVRALRSDGVALPVLMLSALATVEDRAAGLDAGADDYVVKPFNFDELIARLKVQERRMRQRTAQLDPNGWILTGAGRRIVLTEREFALLKCFALRIGDVLTRDEIFATVWAGQGASSLNVVDVYVGQLRRKLDPMADFGFELKTLRNRGFQMNGVAPILL